MKTKPFIISLSLGDKTYKGQGENALEALTSMEKPVKIMHKGILTISNGSLKKELLMQPVKIKRLFFRSRSLLEVVAKQLAMGLK